MPAGRPSKYDPSFCDKVIEIGKIGGSKAEMALELDVAYSTFDLWENENKEFSEAVKKAIRFSQGWWEKNGRSSTFGAQPGFNATSFIFNMKNRFKEDWSDTTIQKTTVSVEKSIYEQIIGSSEGLPD